MPPQRNGACLFSSLSILCSKLGRSFGKLAFFGKGRWFTGEFTLGNGGGVGGAFPKSQ